MVGISASRMIIVQRGESREPSRICKEAIQFGPAMSKPCLAISPSKVRASEPQVKKVISRDKIHKKLKFGYIISKRIPLCSLGERIALKSLVKSQGKLMEEIPDKFFQRVLRSDITCEL